MYEELIKRLREAPSDWPDAELHYEAADAIADLITALTASNEVIAKSKPKWIPVTERLPEDRKMVLATVDGVVRIAFYGNYMWEEVETYSIFYPTHWMPLPQPPKADKDGGV